MTKTKRTLNWIIEKIGWSFVSVILGFFGFFGFSADDINMNYEWIVDATKWSLIVGAFMFGYAAHYNTKRKLEDLNAIEAKFNKLDKLVKDTTEKISYCVDWIEKRKNQIKKLESEEFEKPEEPKQHKILSACMTNCGEKIEDGKRCFTWQLVAKLHINTTERLTILFDKCFAELKHEQYKDIHSNFNDVILVKKEYANNKCVFDKFKECQSSQIVIDTPSTITLLAMGETSVWTPGDQESIALMFNLPVSERDYKPIQIKISVSKIFRNDGEIEFRYDNP